MRRSKLVMSLVLLTLFGQTAKSENLLVNAGFENGDFSGWTVGGNSVGQGVAVDGTLIPGTDAPFTPAFVKANSGMFAGYSLVRCFPNSAACSPVELITLAQVVSLVPDTNYSIGFFLGNHSGGTFGSDIGDAGLQIFVDGVGLLSPGQRNIGGGNEANVIESFSGSFFSGDRTDVTVTFQISGSGSARAAASFDDFYVRPVPEPTTMLLLGTGLAGLGGTIGRRRRGKENRPKK